MYLIEGLKEKTAKAIAEASGTDVSSDLLEYPELPENGDLAFPCFQLAKAMKAAPPKIAGELAAKLVLPDGIARVEANGPYLNFFCDRSLVIDGAADEALDAGSAYGDRKAERPEKVMIEYVSPNNNKPLHLGHVRNGLIGASLSNLLESQGTQVVRALLLNDRGLAIAKAMVAYMKWGNGATPESLGKKGDHYLGDLYVMYEQEAKDSGEGAIDAQVTVVGSPSQNLNPTYRERVGEISKKRASLEAEAHKIIDKWEAGDADTRALWKTMSDWCEAGQHATYGDFGFRFDVEYKESDIYKEGKEIVELGLEKGVFKKDETGAVYADLEAHGLPNKIVLRSDGTSLYVTQDLYLAKKKFDEEKLDASLYVVGNEQNLHFRQLFKMLELLGFDWAPKLKHLSYGYVTLPEGRMKSREGTVVDADDLLSELEKDAAEEIRGRHAGLDVDTLETRARQVALAAIKFHFLEVDVASDMVYDPKASLSFTGKTGPYLQYMHARVRSLLKKAEREPPAGTEGREIREEEFRLAFALARFPEAVRRAADQCRPSLVAGHLYETAKAVAALYEHAPVLNASNDDRAARLRLMEAAGVVLARGMGLLGMEAPEEM